MIPRECSTMLPVNAGIGLRAPHMREIEKRLPTVGWLEVHAENYMNEGVGARALSRLRQHYPVSLHGVGLSLGSAAGVDPMHLARLAAACGRYEPAAVSEHLSWSSNSGVYLNDLLPVPYDMESLRIVSANIARVQDTLKRTIMIENLSAYVGFAQSTMSEPEFLAELVKQTGCQLLLDINNVYVSARNLGFDARAYIAAIPADSVSEIHLAGHVENATAHGSVLIDNHGSKVSPEVWSLYAFAVARFGRRPTLIEWDSDIPPLNVLLGEAMWADLLATAVAAASGPAARPAPRDRSHMPPPAFQPHQARELSHA